MLLTQQAADWERQRPEDCEVHIQPLAVPRVNHLHAKGSEGARGQHGRQAGRQAGSEATLNATRASTIDKAHIGRVVSSPLGNADAQVGSGDDDLNRPAVLSPGDLHGQSSTMQGWSALDVSDARRPAKLPAPGRCQW